MEKKTQFSVCYFAVARLAVFFLHHAWVGARATAVAFVAIWIFVMRRFADRMGSGGFMSIGQSKAKVHVETATKVDFADVAGVEAAKDELKAIVGFLKVPQRASHLGGLKPKVVLLAGPPGTGQTLFAPAVADEAERIRTIAAAPVLPFPNAA